MSRIQSRQVGHSHHQRGRFLSKVAAGAIVALSAYDIFFTWLALDGPRDTSFVSLFLTTGVAVAQLLGAYILFSGNTDLLRLDRNRDGRISLNEAIPMAMVYAGIAIAYGFDIHANILGLSNQYPDWPRTLIYFGAVIMCVSDEIISVMRTRIVDELDRNQGRVDMSKSQISASQSAARAFDTQVRDRAQKEGSRAGSKVEFF